MVVDRFDDDDENFCRCFTFDGVADLDDRGSDKSSDPMESPSHMSLFDRLPKPAGDERVDADTIERVLVRALLAGKPKGFTRGISNCRLSATESFKLPALDRDVPSGSSRLFSDTDDASIAAVSRPGSCVLRAV